MAQSKIAREHKSAASKRVQAFVIAVFFALITFLAFISEASSVEKGVALIALFTLAVITCISFIKDTQITNCPHCWGELEPSQETNGGDGKPILCMCVKCNVLWDCSR